MDKFPDQKNAVQYLYPPVDPYDRRMLDVGDGHQVYVEQSGNPEGIPVVVLHGGPGGGCSPAMRRYFNPSIYRIVLFDQRGCGRSRPHAEVEDNTTWHLVRDIELIRETLGIDAWIVFGGSWGATLALVYAISHPDRASHLVLRGVFLMTRAELDWFYGGGAGLFWPETWHRFRSLVPEDERDDIIAAYHRRLFSGDRATEITYAKAWSAWENALASVRSTGVMGDAPPEYARAFARLESHYFMNAGFLETDGWILDNVGRLVDVPGVVVQGRYDMICPPASAWRLSEAWGRAEINMVPMAGHALSEPGISGALVKVMDNLGR
ncbi:prolyl aminopeptidase [Roseovarius sp. SCSIO 43702]|uniref:prolyl aminopeptidase n=1 Tax=Roseovarius sp. SCSIO 43702 TaxID=2823043 RepID=UPI001C73368A|nr:prolyl aminopeptidase [Roseovarius sp. SCSIO 43702]QYX57028.1 prolyl aminopeptidase [Roseovarius sp. SCSIO 43702]